MQIISILAAGVKGAESGQATISVRGTSTPATTFASFEADSPNTTGSVTLDANGGATVYVDQYVDVSVLSSQGTLVRKFTQGDATSAQEYIGQSFKGPGYSGGAEAVQQGITTQAVFNKWLDSADAPDWKVKLGGVDTVLTTALGNLTGLVFNVKNAVYGAKGDGTTDDTTAIAAAMTAAAAGGIVFFPQGSYRVTSTLAPAAGVSLKGVGPTRSKLIMDSAASNLLGPAASAGVRCFIEDLSLTASQSCTGDLISVSNNWEADVNRCNIGDSLSSINFVDGTSATSLDVRIQNCVFGAPTAGGVAVLMSGITGEVRITGCTFVTPATYNVITALVYGVGLTIEGCIFDVSPSTVGTFSIFSSSSTTVRARITNCTFIDSGGATVTAMTIGFLSTGSKFHEDNNTFPSDDTNGWTAYSLSTAGPGPIDSNVWLGTRVTRQQHLSNNSTTQTIDTLGYGSCYFERTGTAVCTITDGGSALSVPPGNEYRLVLKATGGNTGTITYSLSLWEPTPAAAVITNGSFDMFTLVSGIESGGGAPALLVTSSRRDVATS